MSAASSTAGAFPDRVGKYELLLPLGTGGTATVYLARTRGVAGFEREVALKLVHAHLRADEESRLHLLEEARLAARIRHPNVVPVTEVDADACGVFLVMEYVEGEALSGLVRTLRDHNQRLPTRLIARIMNDALAGLHAAHELRDRQSQLVGLVHRDFSPQNILVGIEGVARLADFGVAKAASRTVRTKTGLVKGKVAYMSPEQARGHRVDRRCDVWAAGVVVWELVTGRKLYDHEDDVATLLSVVTEEPPRLAQVLQGVPSSLDEAVAYALTSDVNRRCPSAETLRCMLESAWDECGGMATPTELGAFVRQTVGHKLAERRALALGGRSPDLTGPASSAPRTPGTEPEVMAVAREDGTKTAISAAVPAAEQRSAPVRIRPWRRSFGLGLAATVAVVAVAVVVIQPNEPVRATAIAQPSPVVVPTLPTAEEVHDHRGGDLRSAPLEVRDLPEARSGGGQDSEGKKRVPDADVSAALGSGRAPRRSSQHAKTTAHRTRSRSGPRASVSRTEKQTSPAAGRVLPLPEPSERQRRRALPAVPGQPAPLQIAPDPYDNEK
ncbi:MAG: serine/threonine-protein kinase [Deltaproteobacteria bacterium]